jgi:uncharacterized protein
LVVLNSFEPIAHPDFDQFGWKALSSLMIGVLEETSLRGLVLVALVRAWGATSSGLIRAVVVSSSVFGVLHLVNLFHSPVIPTLLQVAFATFIGICFAGVFLRTRALLALIVIHSLIDFVEMVRVGSDKPATVAGAVLACVVTFPLALLGLWLIRRGKAAATVRDIRATI